MVTMCEKYKKGNREEYNRVRTGVRYQKRKGKEMQGKQGSWGVGRGSFWLS